jgi:hypothetical protein
MHTFFAIYAIKNYLIWGAGVINIYAQSPPPLEPTFICIDAQYIKRFERKLGVKL